MSCGLICIPSWMRRGHDFSIGKTTEFPLVPPVNWWNQQCDPVTAWTQSKNASRSGACCAENMHHIGRCKPSRAVNHTSITNCCRQCTPLGTRGRRILVFVAIFRRATAPRRARSPNPRSPPAPRGRSSLARSCPGPRGKHPHQISEQSFQFKREHRVFQFVSVVAWGVFMLRESSEASRLSSNFSTAEIRSKNFRAERRRKFFRTIAKHAYPKQTAFELRRLTREKYGERTIYDWIAGRTDAPLSVCIQIMGEILSD